jgi:hypothetical protein
MGQPVVHFDTSGAIASTVSEAGFLDPEGHLIGLAAVHG